MSDFWENNNSGNPTVVVIIALQLCSAISCVVADEEKQASVASFRQDLATKMQ